MQFIAIVSLLVAAVAANPLSIPGKSITLDGTASITFTISKVITVPAGSVPSDVCFTIPPIPTTTLSVPPFTVTNTIPGITIDPKTFTHSLPGATVTFPPAFPTSFSRQ